MINRKQVDLRKITTNKNSYGKLKLSTLCQLQGPDVRNKIQSKPHGWIYTLLTLSGFEDNEYILEKG